MCICIGACLYVDLYMYMSICRLYGYVYEGVYVYIYIHVLIYTNTLETEKMNINTHLPIFFKDFAQC